MTQAAFFDSFGFSLDTVKHWEGGRRTPEVPARAYLTVIQRNPSAVLEALHPATGTPEQVEVAVRRKAQMAGPRTPLQTVGGFELPVGCYPPAMSAKYYIGPKRSGVGAEITITMESSVFGKDFDNLNDAADEAAYLGLIGDAEFQRIFIQKSASSGVSLTTPNLEGRGFRILRRR